MYLYWGSKVCAAKLSAFKIELRHFIHCTILLPQLQPNCIFFIEYSNFMIIPAFSEQLKHILLISLYAGLIKRINPADIT